MDFSVIRPEISDHPRPSRRITGRILLFAVVGGRGVTTGMSVSMAWVWGSGRGSARVSSPTGVVSAVVAGVALAVSRCGHAWGWGFLGCLSAGRAGWGFLVFCCFLPAADGAGFSVAGGFACGLGITVEGGDAIFGYLRFLIASLFPLRSGIICMNEYVPPFFKTQCRVPLF